MPQPDSASMAVFLDFDGTLVDIAARPEAVQPASRLPGLLAQASHSLGGALAIISGRPLAQIDAFLAPLLLPAAGLHGLEMRWADGRQFRDEQAAAPLAAVRGELAEFIDHHPDVHLEDKQLSIALHYRAAPQREAACRHLIDRLVADSAGQLTRLDGKCVCELRPSGHDKGHMVAAFLQHPPFHGRQPVFIGDDVTDEFGFRMAQALGGFGIRVGGMSPATAARYQLPDVAAVLDWLHLLATAPPQD